MFSGRSLGSISIFYLLQKPPSPRNVGMPLAADIPAPVKTNIFFFYFNIEATFFESTFMGYHPISGTPKRVFFSTEATAALID